MVKTVEELQNLIEWAKKTRVKSLKIGEIEVHLSDYAFIETFSDGVEQVPSVPDVSTTKTPEDEKAEKTEEEQDLFWSTR